MSIMTVDIAPRQLGDPVYVSQGDIGRVINVHMYDGDDPYIPPAGVTPYIQGLKPSGLGFNVQGTITDNVCTFSTTDEMTDEVGDMVAEVRLIKTGMDIGTANFRYSVEERPRPDGTTDGTVEVVTDVIAEALETALEDIDTAKAAAIAQLATAGGVVARTAFQMTEPDQVYIYVGSETGYSTGYWYYNNGTNWVPGGQYGGAITDTTLSISGKPADAKAVGDALADFTIEVDDTLSISGKPADAKAVGDALAEKADISDVEAEITALDERVATLESGGDDVPYEEKGDLYTLFVSAEVEEMKKSNYRLSYNSTTGVVTEQSYTAGQPAIHYFDPAKIGYERIWVYQISAVWNVLADYDPDTDTYTLIANISSGNNTGKLVDLTVADGHYIATSSTVANWVTGKYSYLGRLWIKPGYTSKYEGWDVPISDKPVPCELYPVSLGYPAFYIDMEKYQDQLVRIINNGTMASGVTFGNRVYPDLVGTSYIEVSTLFSIGDFSAWIYSDKYYVFFYRSANINANTINLTMGHVPPENARKAKEEGRWGAKLAFHNVDTPNELIFACAVGSLLDIDTSRTLDGYHVCIHNTVINGHTIAQTNLEDLELTYNQMEFTRALKIMKKYGTICYVNSRGCTAEQEFDLVNRIYNYFGIGIVYDTQLSLSATEFFANHIDKFYTWASGVSLDTLVNLGAKPGRIFANESRLEGTSYNKADVILVKSIASGETLSNFAWDGECAYLWINDNTPGFVRG